MTTASLQLKQLLVRSGLGRAAVWLRDPLARQGPADLECAGTRASDRLAALLTPRLCARDGAFLDIGAHIGSVIMEVRAVAPGARVIAFEAVPEKAAHLKKSFPDVIVHACALGESDGEVTFYVDLKKPGFSSLLAAPRTDDAVREITVPLRRLDSLVEPCGVQVVKIDVEGAELRVLEGGRRLFETDRPVIMFESGAAAPESLERDKAPLWRWLDGRGFAVLLPHRLAHLDDGMSEPGFLESHLYPPRSTNYFAVPRERRDGVRRLAREAFQLPTA